MTPPPKFRIGVDGFNMALRRGTGIATYGRNLAHCLRDMGHPVDIIFGMNISKRMSPPLREIIFFDSLDEDHINKPPKIFSTRWWDDRQASWAGHEAVEIPISGRVEARGFQQRLPGFDRLLNVPALFRNAAKHYRRTGRFTNIRMPDPPAVMHWTYPLPIRLQGARNIYTVHDLVPLRLPYTTLDDKGVHYRLIHDLVKTADLICTVSESSKRDITAFFPSAAEKIFNTYQSILPNTKIMTCRPHEIAAELAALFGLQPDSYFLFFGSLEPKKNIGRMIEACLAAQTARKLVIVGATGWRSENELRFLQHGIQTGRILHLEYLPETSLMTLVRGARFVLFPSLAEGFGLPVLEALALGTPVLTSHEGALPEVAGDAAIMVDAYDITAITAAIIQLDTQDEICAGLRAKAPAQAAKFSTNNYQKKLQTLYATAIAASPAAPRE